MKGVADRTLELMNEYQADSARKSWRTFQHFLVVKIEELEDENEEWKVSFDLYHKALMRGTKRWKEAHPEVEYLPDTAKMMEWFVDSLRELEGEDDETK